MVLHYQWVESERRYTPELINSFDDRRRILLLTKGDVRLLGTERLARSPGTVRLRCEATSGSTVAPLSLYREPVACDALELANLERQSSWVGFRLHDRAIMCLERIVPRTNARLRRAVGSGHH
jgi:hypothetical protein